MKYKMVFGLKLGCVYCILVLRSITTTLTESQTTTTLDLPLYGIHDSIYPVGHTEDVGNNVYWNHLAKAFQQYPQEIMQGIENSRDRLQNERHMLQNQYDQQFVWDPNFGAIPVVRQNPADTIVKAIPVLLLKTVTIGGSNGKTFKFVIPQEGYVIRRNTDCDPNVTPTLSFNDGGESVDPCTGKSKNQAEFGLTATSGMSDVLCLFCQHIKNLQCIWQFCSHPDGVYKIKVKGS